MKRLRVAMRMHAFPNLSETFILNQIQFLLKRNVEVHLFVNQVKWSNLDLKTIHPDLFIHIVPGQSFNLLSSIKNVRHLKKIVTSNIKSLLEAKKLLVSKIPDFEFNVYHCQFASFIKESSLMRKKSQIKFKNLISSGRGYDVSRDFQNKPEDFIPYFEELDLFLPVSESLSENFRKNNFPESKISILHSGIDLEKFTYKPNLLNKLSCINFITVGRLVEKKGLFESIQTIEVLIQRGYKVRYDIYGDGELYTGLNEYIKKKNLGEKVVLMGATPNKLVLDAVSQADYFLLHSKTAQDGNTEGIPNVLKEAMALGVLPITTKHGGIPELFPKEYLQYLSEEGDVIQMADNIEKLLHMEPKEKEKLLLLNRKKIEEDFDIIKLTDELLQHYSKFF